MKYVKQDKVNKIKLNKDNMYVVIDFDKTITATSSMDSWDVTGKNLSEEFNLNINKLYNKYRPIELDYKISKEEKNTSMENWYNAVMDLYFEYNLKKIDIEKSVKEKHFKFRKGAKEFLNYMYKNNIPVIIISAGIGNAIEKFLKENNCLHENITVISNFIEFDKNGNMKKFKNEMIHSLNKNIKHDLPNKVKEQIKNKQFILLVGDSIEDIKMVPNDQLKNTISVNFLNQKIEENLEKATEIFDIVLTNEDANFDIARTLVILKDL